MNDERATIRPVTIARLVEAVDACKDAAISIETIGDVLDTSDRRATEVTAEAARIGLLEQLNRNPAEYRISNLGKNFLYAIREEDWRQVSELLSEHSPHYAVIREELRETGPATQTTLLERLGERQTEYTFNETGVDIVCDWGERLGDLQRHAFSGRYYVVETRERLDTEFHSVLLSEYDELNGSVGLDVQQRYVSVARLRECVCERLRCTRDVFDDTLVALVESNIGKLELTGAPRDTTAKDAALGIKRIQLSENGGVVTTVQSTDRVLRGIEYRNRQYYYFVDQRPDHPITPRESEEKL